MNRRYYSLRTGKNEGGMKLDLEGLKALFLSEYRRLDEACYFQEYFGYYCVDAGDVAGRRGSNIGARMAFDLRKADLWPIPTMIEEYSEDDLFDVIEYIYDNVSKPIAGRYHDFSGCGWHYKSFDQETGRAEYRDALNQLLQSYGEGFELSEVGEILQLGPEGTQELLVAAVPSADTNVTGRMTSAIAKFRRYRSTDDERRDAVRDLADVLEYLRPEIRSILIRADENDLFNIANNFSVRHHNAGQKADYDHDIWLSWMFYFYLATIHTCLRLIERAKD